MATLFADINWLDIIFFAILAGMIYKGSHAGVGSQLLSLMWWFVLIFFSLNYYTSLSEGMFGFIRQSWGRAISFILIVTVMSGLVKFLEMIFNVSVTDNLAPLERIGGAIVSSIRTFLLFGIIGTIFLLIPISFLQDSVRSNSKTGMLFVNADIKVYSFMTQQFDFVTARGTDEILDEIIASSEKRGTA